MATVKAKAIERALSTMDFPASKDELVEHVTSINAPVPIVAAIRGLPLGEYANAGDVLASVDLESTRLQSESAKAQRARQDGPPGVAEHLRDLDR